MHVLIAGSSGFIGSALVSELTSHGHEVTRLVRSTSDPNVHGILWNPATAEIDREQLHGIEAIVNLAGAPIAKRWSKSSKGRILDSRVQATELLADVISRLDPAPYVLVSGSAVGYYGYDRGDCELTESASNGTGFLADVTRAWESATEPASLAGVRVVLARTGIVLAPSGGALRKMLPLFRARAGGRLGSGEQYMSWITLRDQVRAIRHLIENQTISGPVNLTAPCPVTNREFTEALAQALGRRAVVPAPALGLRLALGREMADEMLLGGQRVVPSVLADSGFEFDESEIHAALVGMLGGP